MEGELDTSLTRISTLRGQPVGISFTMSTRLHSMSRGKAKRRLHKVKGGKKSRSDSKEKKKDNRRRSDSKEKKKGNRRKHKVSKNRS